MRATLPKLPDPATPHVFSTIPAQNVDWLWPRYLPRGKITLLIGDPGVGKSLLTLDLAARLSRGYPFPDYRPIPLVQPVPTPSPIPQISNPNADHPIPFEVSPDGTTTFNPGPIQFINDLPAQEAPFSPITNHQSPITNPHSTLILAADDDPSDTIRPRLEAAGADLSRIHLLTTLKTLAPTAAPIANTDAPDENPLTILESAIQQTPDIALLIIDPITTFLGFTDRLAFHRARTVLAAIADMAARHNIAVILTTRLNKSIDRNPLKNLYRATGSLAFVAAARAIWLLTQSPTPIQQLTNSPDQQDPLASSITNHQSPITNQLPTLFLPIKSNLSAPPTGLAFTIDDQKLNFLIDRLDSIPRALAPPDPMLRAATDWLINALSDGPVPSKRITKEAKENAITHHMLRRAQASLSIKPIKVGYRDGWFWSLPDDERVIPTLYEEMDLSFQNELSALKSRKKETPSA